MQTIRRRQDAGAWSEILARYASSGLTVKAFCQSEGIRECNFYRWRSQLRGTVGTRRPQKNLPVNSASAADFIDLGALSSGSSRLEVRVELGGGVVLRLARS
jgi:transposase-like protein